jgi:2-amino-4-hydroxy-6-hydroxymethyldihydropteridine diphosphokinase
MTRVYLALGANVGDAVENIRNAIALMSSAIHNIQEASLYASKAVGYTDQPDFINTAIRGETELSAEELLEFLKETEKKVGRIKRFRWGPREIDIDIISYGDKVQYSENLTLPHPRYRDRDFVLVPLLELDSSFVDPETHQNLHTLIEMLPASQHSIIRKI